MSGTQKTLSQYTDRALERIGDFFDHYIPTDPRDRQWCKQRQIELEAEIIRRENEDKEGLK